jgi:hypothetical protein
VSDVNLVSIHFNHDPRSGARDAINVRRNGRSDDFSAGPEWRRGETTRPQDSVAAYAARQVGNNRVTIRVRLQRTVPINEIEVRAVDPTIDREAPSGCAGFFLWFLRGVVRAVFGNVSILGDVVAKRIVFGTADEVEELFECSSETFARPSVRDAITTWQWEYRASSSDRWQPFDATTHLIFKLLDSPTLPWRQEPYEAGNLALPRIDVLTYACSWARLAGDESTAAGRVVDNVLSLAPARITYDCPSRVSHYTDLFEDQQFFVSAFLDRLRGRPSLGPFVNCTDCATIVATFANAVGCDLDERRLYHPNLQPDREWAFKINEVLAIGHSAWSTACGVDNFRFHEVAWKGEGGPAGRIWDSCLRVDADSDPTRAPHVPLLVRDYPFGSEGSGHYLDRLAAPTSDGRPRCIPQSAQRRPVRDH